jgi:hypothetical protein
MKLKLICLFLITNSLFCLSRLQAQVCPNIALIPTRPTCGNANGSIQLSATNSSFESMLYNLTTNAVAYNYAAGTRTFSNLPAGEYYFVNRKVAVPKDTCQSYRFTLNADLGYTFTGIGSAPSNCFSMNGYIDLSGFTATDQVSWIINATPTFTTLSSLPNGSAANTKRITGLDAGIYTIRIRKAATPLCWKDMTIRVPEPAGGCVVPTCTGALSSGNLFPDGSFGASGERTNFVNGPSMPPFTTENLNYFSVVCGSGSGDNCTCVGTRYEIGNKSGCPQLSYAFSSQSWVATHDAPVGDPDHDGIIGDDHTPGDIGGYMLIADPDNDPLTIDKVYSRVLTNLCPDKDYNFSAWVYNLNPSGVDKPNLTFLIDGIGKYQTGDITASGWIKVGFKFRTITGQTSAVFSIISTAPNGTSGNDFAIDDIAFQGCGPANSVTTNAPEARYCPGQQVTISNTVSDIRPDYRYFRWERSINNGVTWTVLGADSTSTLVNGLVNYTTSYSPGIAAPSMNNYQYRLVLGTAPISSLAEQCRFNNPATVLTIHEVPDAGADQVLACTQNASVTSTTLSATSNLATGRWTQISPASQAAIVSPTAKTTTVNGLATGTNYKFIWTTSAGCRDTMMVLVPIAGSCTALPVKLNTFEATAKQTYVALSWKSSMELDLLKYEVEHSVDAKKWQLLSSVNAIDSPAGSAYERNDYNPGEGTNYYRLKMVDLDGTFSYSPVKKVIYSRMQVNYNFSMKPNPAHHLLQIDLDNPLGTPGMLTITNYLGQIVLRQGVNSGSNQATLNLSSIAKGFYIVSFETEGVLQKKKLSIE